LTASEKAKRIRQKIVEANQRLLMWLNSVIGVGGPLAMIKKYVERRDGGYWIAGSRVSLDSIVYAFLNGQTAESIAQSFPMLALEQVYGAIAFYLSNRTEIDAYLTRARADFEVLRQAARDTDPMFYQKLADARRSGDARQP
jgi:uncharacterized protein (DUF433 family)